MVHKTLRAIDNPFLDDHIIGGNRVFPTVCAIAWMAQAAQSVLRGFRCLGVENYQLLKGIVLSNEQIQAHDGIACNIELEVFPDGDRLLADARISSQPGKGLPAYHYSARLILAPQPLPSVACDLSIASIAGEHAADLYSDGTLFHRDSLRGIERVLRCDVNGLLLACRVPDSALRKQGDFPVAQMNIFANDLMYQAMLVWVRKISGMGSLPTATRVWKMYREARCGELMYLELKATLDPARRNQNAFTADICLVGEDKTLIAEVNGAEVMASESLKNAFGSQ